MSQDNTIWESIATPNLEEGTSLQLSKMVGKYVRVKKNTVNFNVGIVFSLTGATFALAKIKED